MKRSCIPLIGTAVAVAMNVHASAGAFYGNRTEHLPGSGREAAHAAFCEKLRARIAWAEEWGCTAAAYFDDNETERRLIPDLYDKFARDPDSLTPVENAIREAANRVGLIAFNNCKDPRGKSIMANAFLVRIESQDAILTNLHIVLDEEGGKPHHGCTYADLVGNVEYFPFASYLDDRKDQQSDSTFDGVKLSSKVVYNLKKWAVQPDDLWDIESKNKYDWIIFRPEENISGRKAPDGTTVGYLAKDQAKPDEYEDGYTGYIIGFDPKFAKETGSNASSYQECTFFHWDEKVMHTCDTTVGASSSLLGVYVDGEIRFRGIHNRRSPVAHNSSPRKRYGKFGSEVLKRMLNGGLLAETIEQAGGFSFDGPSEAGSQPEVPADRLAYQIQRALQKAGCYSGQLDNVWGPASRRALANFAERVDIAVPGTEPSPAVLSAVENAPRSARCE